MKKNHLDVTSINAFVRIPPDFPMQMYTYKYLYFTDFKYFCKNEIVLISKNLVLAPPESFLLWLPCFPDGIAWQGSSPHIVPVTQKEGCCSWPPGGLYPPWPLCSDQGLSGEVR